jgi:hypothetical protein
VCALSQAAIADRFESDFATTTPGGAGGGGGATRSLLANNINGAGGGGGGGALRIASLGNLLLSGTIRARGGAGGNGDVVATDYGASGGGGAGGSIWIQSAGSVSGAGILDVSGGTGGQDVGMGSFGGNGSRGVIRIDASTQAFTGTYTPAGTADQNYAVFPVTTEFTISAGPACGTFGGPAALFVWIAFFLVYRLRTVRGRVPS